VQHSAGDQVEHTLATYIHTIGGCVHGQLLGPKPLQGTSVCLQNSDTFLLVEFANRSFLCRRLLSLPCRGAEKATG
jgi:hypothetical protein